jgi:tetratricopeptide (TPR) repeat protein
MRSERYLCHDEKQLAAAVSRLETVQPRQIMILAGVVGSGRRHFLHIVAERLTQRGQTTQIVPLSLDGFEPLGPGLPPFVEYQLAFGRGGQERPEALAAQFRQLAERIAKNPAAAVDGRWAVVFALLLQLPDSEGEATLTGLLASETALAPEPIGAKALADLSASPARLLLHIPAESTLSDTTLFWAMSQAFEHPKVCMVFSCAPQLASEALTGGARIPCSGLRVELPMKPDIALTRAREVNHTASLGLDEAALTRVAQQCHGSAGRLARELELVVAAKAGAVEADQPVRAQLDRWFSTLGDDAPMLRKLLCWAAACGEVAPILPLMAAAQCTQADAERIIDRLDEEVCGPDAPLPMLDDLAYRHPGFPGLAVYRFRDPALRQALLDAADPAAQLESERELLNFLGQRLGIGTRSTAQLFVNLAERVQFEHSAGARQRLRLWVSPAEALPLEQLLRADVTAGRLPADALFTTALRDHTMPPHQRLALLEASAVQETELPVDRRTMLTGLRTELLCGLGRFQEALTSAERGFELLGQQDPEPQGVRGLLLFLRANCQRQLGQPDAALVSFKEAAEQAKKPRPDGSIDYHNIGVCLAEAGHCHAEREQWEPAVALLREGIAALRQSPMDENVKNEQIAQLEKNLAVCEAKLQTPATV